MSQWSQALQLQPNCHQPHIPVQQCQTTCHWQCIPTPWGSHCDPDHWASASQHSTQSSQCTPSSTNIDIGSRHPGSNANSTLSNPSMTLGSLISSTSSQPGMNHLYQHPAPCLSPTQAHWWPVSTPSLTTVSPRLAQAHPPAVKLQPPLQPVIITFHWGPQSHTTRQH